MPSPFPGMDPFIEMQEWSDFHARYMTVLSELLTPQVRPRYVVRVERRVYLEQPFGEPDQVIPDVAILERRGISRSSSGTALLGEPTAAIAAVECLLPEAEEHHEYYLVLRDRETLRIVTLIELLSPTNKRAGSEGREQYLDKREEILQSRTNLVELDLLRGGQRLPMQSESAPRRLLRPGAAWLATAPRGGLCLDAAAENAADSDPAAEGRTGADAGLAGGFGPELRPGRLSGFPGLRTSPPTSARADEAAWIKSLLSAANG